MDKDTAHFEPLGKDMAVLVSKDHGFGTDALLLADFCQTKTQSKICELGSGCGIISLLLYKKGFQNITAIEIQKKACIQFRRSIEYNHAEKHIHLIQHDLRQLDALYPAGAFDLILMNPPYKPVGHGITSKSEADKIARHETLCTIDDVCRCASYLLKFGGKLCLCHRPERLSEVMTGMVQHGIEPKRLRMVAQEYPKKPWLFLIEGRKGSGHGLTIEPLLVLKNPDQTDSEEMIRIFGDYPLGKKREL